MSAIFGIINKDGTPVKEALVTKMQQSLLHRAVDGKNIHTEENMMFGHHKLIVHRRQTLEQQPLQLDDCIITNDARIDNIDELIKELELDIPLKKITDSLIILKAYKKWGNDCVNHLEGEFTFAIWDKIKKTFYGASDHMGFRTFYYYENDEIFAFASEIKAIESIKKEPLELNNQIFIDHYANALHPITYDKKIHVLLTAHYLVLNLNIKRKSIIKRHCLVTKRKKYKFKYSYEWQNCLLELLTNKIKCQIDSNYPIGILLSGGLDSSLVAAIACKLLKKQNRNLLAFCSVLPDNYQGNDKDERFYIEKLKEAYDNLEINYVTIPDDIGPYSGLEEAFNRIEAPMNSLHYVETALFESAKKLNVRTLLTGFGGDMTISFTGYGTFYYYLRNFIIIKSLRLFLKKYYAEKHGLIFLIKTEILAYNSIYKKIRDAIKKNNYNSHSYLKKKYINKVIKYEKREYDKRHFENMTNNSEISTYLLRFRKHGLAYHLEFLSPILDKNIFKLFVDIPHEELSLNGIERSLIKETMRGLVPNEITNRLDKLLFSPDYEKRISKIKIEYLKTFERDKVTIEEKTGIDFAKLSRLILNIDQLAVASENKVKDEVFYIPRPIIAAKFYLWLKLKSGQKN